MARTLPRTTPLLGRIPYRPWVWVLALALAVLAGAAPPLLSLGVVLGGVALFVLLKWPVWGAYALVLSVPVQQTVRLPGGVTFTQLLFVLVLGIWFAWMSLRGDRRLVLTPIAVTLVFFLTATLPSLWGTASLPESLAEIARWAVTILSYVVIINSVQTRRQMNGLIVVMLVAGMSESILGLVQAYTGIGPESFGTEGGILRAYGTIGAPNSFAGYINMSVPLALALSFYFWGRWAAERKAAHVLDRPSFVTWERLRAPILMSGVFVVLFWTMVTTLSRGAWVGLAFGVLVMVFALGRRASGAIALIVAGAAALVLLALVNALPPAVSERFGQLVTQIAVFDPRGVTPNPDNYALVERMVHWQAAGNMFLASPWTGVGIGNFNTLFNTYGVQGWIYPRGHAHNYYLHLLAEVGIVGFLGYMSMLATSFVVGFRALKRVRRAGDTYGEAVVIGALGILTTFAAHNFFENLHALNMGIHWAAALSLFTLAWLRSPAMPPPDERSSA
jgi:O-antigen ligase